jgi:hypothetical protein
LRPLIRGIIKLLLRKVRDEMKRNRLFNLALVTMVAVAIHNVRAGSAIALGPDHKMIVVAGVPVEIAKQRALAEARRKFGPNVRVVGYSDATGYCAIAVARHPNGYGWIVCASLGKRSPTEAYTLAIEHCLKLGGRNPRVTSSFRG